ncbi:hypothetical protein IP81_00540 [Novosphingobium sp. AAP83]|uniref:glycosyltransferase n=1 Tax=Novosphingobium sp. AAP83 TaxID=1523425 RepID=UPI0006B99F58|nr:glycosyltransferase [Novosphingobium sp. AAP83]KPF93997.1 hypothetical protein IP81_00540 [Novosphingobium sp. AAP83]
MTAPPSNRPLIVHVSGDFPDPVEPFKTPVIRTLIDLTATQFKHRVFSLNRLAPSPRQLARDVFSGNRADLRGVRSSDFAYGTAIEYAAPSKGIFHETILVKLGNWLAGELAKGERPALIVGHKLSTEGLVAERAADLLGIPYAVSIQGDTDTKIVRARPDLAKSFSRVFHRASTVFPFAPWALHAMEDRFGPRQGPSRLLPCPTDIDTPVAPLAGGSGFISVFHLKNYKRKNLPGMCRAMNVLRSRGVETSLKVVGGGSQSDFAACLREAGAQSVVGFPGAKDRSGIRDDMSRAAGFVMPSLRESFGLVFIEALFCGLPIIYPRGAAVDGFFEGKPFAIKVDAHDPEAIADAMQHVLVNESSMKAALAQWQVTDEAARFTREWISREFAAGIAEAIAS